MRSGFVAIVGRPNVGKSTLLNRLLGEKVSIVSDKPQTTRHAVRGVLERPDAQIVFVDTPGIHKPRTPLGGRLNATAIDAQGGVDAVCVVLDAAAGVGRGDQYVLARAPSDAVIVLNKIDRQSPPRLLEALAAAAGAAGAAHSTAEDRHEYYPVSARTGEGVDELAAALALRLPEGPALFPPGVVRDAPDAFWAAELVREELLARVEEELPHSIATRVTEWEWPRIRCEILVERDSQKGIVIGKGGLVLKAVGEAVRAQLPAGAYLELFVRVDKNWQRRPKALDRLGY
ncbi:MAG: GTPase Era [Acidimicrobiales bacterium]